MKEKIIKIAKALKINDETKIFSKKEIKLLKMTHSSTELKNYLVAYKNGVNDRMDLLIAKIEKLK